MSNDVNHVDLHSVTVVPDWLYRYLTNKGIGADYLFSNLVLDERLSVEDIAIVIYLNYAFSISENYNIRLSTYDLSAEIQSRKQPDQDRLNRKIQDANSWSFSDRVKKEVEDRLQSVYDEASPPYEFIVTGSKIWLVVQPGFLTYLKNATTRLDFYRDYLSTVNQIAPFYAVSRTDVFANYVKELIG